LSIDDLQSRTGKFSLPDFGEGRVGFYLTYAVPQSPTLALPEDGEGENEEGKVNSNLQLI
jgi:hypothetical protein